MYLNVYVPQLQHTTGVVSFFRRHRAATFVSAVLMDTMTKAFIGALEQFAHAEGIPLFTFTKDQRKDDVAAIYLAQFIMGYLAIKQSARSDGCSGTCAAASNSLATR